MSSNRPVDDAPMWPSMSRRARPASASASSSASSRSSRCAAHRACGPAGSRRARRSRTWRKYQIHRAPAQRTAGGATRGADSASVPCGVIPRRGHRRDGDAGCRRAGFLQRRRLRRATRRARHHPRGLVGDVHRARRDDHEAGSVRGRADHGDRRAGSERVRRRREVRDRARVGARRAAVLRRARGRRSRSRAATRSTTFATVPTVTTERGGGYSERGLLGLALSPSFATDHFVYAFYSRNDFSTQVVVRFTDCAGVASEPTTLLTLPVGGRLLPQGRPDRVRARRQALRDPRRRARHHRRRR